MKRNRTLPFFLCCMLLILILFAQPIAIYGEREGELKVETLVSLGDSITSGYNLEDPKRHAFPYLIGDGRYEVVNLGVPGWTSSDLLVALKQDDFYWENIMNADAITVNIGSNDLLHAMSFYELLEDPSTFNPEQVQEDLQEAKYVLWKNLTEIMETIRFHSQEPIILYNIYNPIVSDDSFLLELLYIIVDEIIIDINNNIIQSHHSTDDQVLVVNAYGIFSGQQGQYILPGDIHPNQQGQYRLAEIGKNALDHGIYFDEEINMSDEEITVGTIDLVEEAEEEELEEEKEEVEEEITLVEAVGSEEEGEMLEQSGFNRWLVQLKLRELMSGYLSIRNMSFSFGFLILITIILVARKRKRKYKQKNVPL